MEGGWECRGCGFWLLDAGDEPGFTSRREDGGGGKIILKRARQDRDEVMVYYE